MKSPKLLVFRSIPPPPLDTLFEEVYEQMPWHLREQREWLLQQKRTKSPHAH